MSENNDASNESNSLSSDGIIQSSRLASNPLIRTGVLRPSVLGPSVLGSVVNNSNASATDNIANKTDVELNNVLANNPFLKEQNDEDDSIGAEADSTEKSGEGAVGGVASTDNKTDNSDEKKADDEDVDDRPDPLTLLRRNGMERSNMFAAAKNSIPLVEKSGFVFGQNVHERVVGENINTEKSTNAEKNDSVATTSGELLFSSVIQNAATAANKAAETSDAGAAAGSDPHKETELKSLTEVAREYEESRAQKRKYEEVETFTGEENEVNIIDINCKLFAFVNSNWEERGRGSLRLNDSKIEDECSRVVFRTAGNLRLLVNTKVWAGMVAERPSQKSLRLTAMDQTGIIKIFLVMARPVEINSLHSALVLRIDKRKLMHPEECRRADVHNNGDDDGDELKNGSNAEPDLDDKAEPSPKKPVIAAIEGDEASN